MLLTAQLDWEKEIPRFLIPALVKTGFSKNGVWSFRKTCVIEGNSLGLGVCKISLRKASEASSGFRLREAPSIPWAWDPGLEFWTCDVQGTASHQAVPRN